MTNIVLYSTVTVQEILSQELSSVTLAAELLLQHILTLDENGWFQEFLDVLESQGLFNNTFLKAVLKL